MNKTEQRLPKQQQMNKTKLNSLDKAAVFKLNLH